MHNELLDTLELDFDIFSQNTKAKKVLFKKHLYICISLKKYLTGLVGRAFANGPEDLGSIPGHVIPKT